MKNTNPNKKMTIEINGEKVTASKRFFNELSILFHESYERRMKDGFEHYAKSEERKAMVIYEALAETGYYEEG